MQRRLNSRDHARRYLFEATCFPNLFDNIAKYALSIVPFAEEPSVQRLQPRLPPPVGDQSQTDETGINPTPVLHDRCQRLLAVERYFQHQNPAENRNDSDHGAASQCILQTLTNDDLNVENLVAKDCVRQTERASRIQRKNGINDEEKWSIQAAVETVEPCSY